MTKVQDPHSIHGIDIYLETSWKVRLKEIYWMIGKSKCRHFFKVNCHELWWQKPFADRWESFQLRLFCKFQIGIWWQKIFSVKWFIVWSCINFSIILETIDRREIGDWQIGLFPVSALVLFLCRGVSFVTLQSFKKWEKLMNILQIWVRGMVIYPHKKSTR